MANKGFNTKNLNALLKKVGAEILEVSFLIELAFLNGRDRLPSTPIRSLVVY